MRIFFLSLVIWGLIPNSQSNLCAKTSFNLFKIDEKDSVYLKMSEAVLNENMITIPVYIESDDDINALDFSMIFDTEKLAYQSIVDHTGHIQYTDFFNPNDATLRFTSNSFTLYAINKKIISIRFKVTPPCIETKDILSMISYLNGDLCSSKLPEATVCAPSSIEELDTQVDIYPNPASREVNIYTAIDAELTMFTIDGSPVFSEAKLQENETNSIIIANYPSGLYFLRIQSGQKYTFRKLIIQHHY